MAKQRHKDKRRITKKDVQKYMRGKGVVRFAHLLLFGSAPRGVFGK